MPTIPTDLHPTCPLTGLPMRHLTDKQLDAWVIYLLRGRKSPEPGLKDPRKVLAVLVRSQTVVSTVKNDDGSTTFDLRIAIPGGQPFEVVYEASAVVSPMTIARDVYEQRAGKSYEAALEAAIAAYVEPAPDCLLPQVSQQWEQRIGCSWSLGSDSVAVGEYSAVVDQNFPPRTAFRQALIARLEEVVPPAS